MENVPLSHIPTENPGRAVKCGTRVAAGADGDAPPRRGTAVPGRAEKGVLTTRAVGLTLGSFLKVKS